MVEKKKGAGENGRMEPNSGSLLTPEAKRALAEAAERRRKNPPDTTQAKELDGPAGPEPTRYGDWESKGIASDF